MKLNCSMVILSPSLEKLRPRSVSYENVALKAFNFLKLEEYLKTLGFSGPQLAAATGTIIGRMCRPASEPATHYWLQNVSGLGERKKKNSP